MRYHVSFFPSPIKSPSKPILTLGGITLDLDKIDFLEIKEINPLATTERFSYYLKVTGTKNEKYGLFFQKEELVTLENKLMIRGIFLSSEDEKGVRTLKCETRIRSLSL